MQPKKWSEKESCNLTNYRKLDIWDSADVSRTIIMKAIVKEVEILTSSDSLIKM